MKIEKKDLAALRKIRNQEITIFVAAFAIRLLWLELVMLVAESD